MKRHQALVPLSQDHHHVLVIAQKLRRATGDSAAEAASEFAALWNDDQRRHFRIEEELLLPAYAEHGAADHLAVIRTLVQHMLIRRDAARLASEPSLELVHEMGARLAEHVQHEERELFPLIEATIPEPDLRALGERLRTA